MVDSPSLEDLGSLLLRIRAISGGGGDRAPLDTPLAGTGFDVFHGGGGVVIGIGPVGPGSATGGDHGAEPFVVGRIGDLGGEILGDGGIDVLQIRPIGGGILGVDLRQHLEDESKSCVLDLGNGIGKIAVTVVPYWTHVLSRHVGIQSVVEEIVAK